MELNPVFGKTTIADNEFRAALLKAKKAQAAVNDLEQTIWEEIGRTHGLRVTPNIRTGGLYFLHPGRKAVRELEDKFHVARDQAIEAARLVVPRSMYPSGQSGRQEYRRALARYVDAKLSS